MVVCQTPFSPPRARAAHKKEETVRQRDTMYHYKEHPFQALLLGYIATTRFFQIIALLVSVVQRARELSKLTLLSPADGSSQSYTGEGLM